MARWIYTSYWVSSQTDKCLGFIQIKVPVNVKLSHRGLRFFLYENRIEILLCCKCTFRSLEPCSFYFGIEHFPFCTQILPSLCRNVLRDTSVHFLLLQEHASCPDQCPAAPAPFSTCWQEGCVLNATLTLLSCSGLLLVFLKAGNRFTWTGETVHFQDTRVPLRAGCLHALGEQVRS